jgi:hypothetical protein
MQLESMPTAELEALRAEVEAMIAAKIAERRQHLETELAKLAGIFGERTARNAKAIKRGASAAQGRQGAGIVPRRLNRVTLGREPICHSRSGTGTLNPFRVVETRQYRPTR